nr:uncharacterized protein LOC109146618 [Ipomoea batatas]
MVKAVLVLFFIVSVLTIAHGDYYHPPPLPFCYENKNCWPLCKECAICACCNGECVVGCTQKALEFDLSSVMNNCSLLV